MRQSNLGSGSHGVIQLAHDWELMRTDFDKADKIESGLLAFAISSFCCYPHHFAEVHFSRYEECDGAKKLAGAIASADGFSQFKLETENLLRAVMLQSMHYLLKVAKHSKLDGVPIFQSGEICLDFVHSKKGKKVLSQWSGEPPSWPEILTWEQREALPIHQQEIIAIARTNLHRLWSPHFATRFPSITKDSAHEYEEAITGNWMQEFEANVPPLDVESGDWIRSKKENEKKLSVQVSSLKRYRQKAHGGRVSPCHMFGIGNYGRKWRKKNTPKSHVYYWLPSLKSGDQTGD